MDFNEELENVIADLTKDMETKEDNALAVVEPEEEKKSWKVVLWEKVPTGIREKLKDAKFVKNAKKVVVGALAVGMLAGFAACNANINNSKSKEDTGTKDLDKVIESVSNNPIPKEDDEIVLEPVIEEEKEEVVTKSIDELAHEVIAGKWGNGQERKERLEAAGYDFDAVQKRVNELMQKGQTTEVTQPEVVTPSVDTNDDVQTPVVETPEAEVPNPVIPVYPVETPTIDTPIAPEVPIETLGPPIAPPIVEEIIIPGPSYTIDGDEEIIDKEFIPNPDIDHYPDDVPDTKPVTGEEINLAEGESYITKTEDGSVAVDNSNGANLTDVPSDIDSDYTANGDAISGVHYNDSDNSVTVTVDPDKIPTDQSGENKPITDSSTEVTDDYLKLLEELGINNISETTGASLEDGRTR